MSHKITHFEVRSWNSKWWMYSLSPYRQQSICLVKYFLQNATDKQTMNVEQ